MTEHEKHCCRVCGLYYPDYYPWEESGDLPTFDICEGGGVEFGYEDFQPSAARRYRQSWVAGGAQWSHPKARPGDWDLAGQLANVPADWA